MPKTKRILIKEDLQKRMEEKKLTSPLYVSLLDQYMDAYDRRCEMKKRLKDPEITTTQYIAYSGEIRQVEKSMDSLRNRMGIDPAEEMAESEEDYDL